MLESLPYNDHEQSMILNQNIYPLKEKVYANYRDAKLSLDVMRRGTVDEKSFPIGMPGKLVFTVDSSGNRKLGLTEDSHIPMFSMDDIYEIKNLSHTLSKIVKNSKRGPVDRFARRLGLDFVPDWGIVEQAYQAQKILQSSENGKNEKENNLLLILNRIITVSISYLKGKKDKNFYDDQMKTIPDYVKDQLIKLSKGRFNHTLSSFKLKSSVEKSFYLTRSDIQNGVPKAWPGIFKPYRRYIEVMSASLPKEVDKIHLMDIGAIFRGELLMEDINLKFVDGGNIYEKMIQLLNVELKFLGFDAKAQERNIQKQISSLRKIRRQLKGPTILLNSKILLNYWDLKLKEDPGTERIKPVKRSIIRPRKTNFKKPSFEEVLMKNHVIKTYDFVGLCKAHQKFCEDHEVFDLLEKKFLLKIAVRFKLIPFSVQAMGILKSFFDSNPSIILEEEIDPSPQRQGKD